MSGIEYYPTSYSTFKGYQANVMVFCIDTYTLLLWAIAMVNECCQGKIQFGEKI